MAWSCLEKVVAVAGGATAAAFGVIDPGTAIGAAMGGSGLLAYWREGAAQHGPESERALAQIRTAVRAGFEADGENDWTTKADIAAADAALDRSLGACLLDRTRLAASAVNAEVFPKAATALILAELATHEPIFALPGTHHAASATCRAFATRVIELALVAALENREYFARLLPYLLTAMAQGIGELKVATAEIKSDTAAILDILRASGFFADAAARGIPEPAVRAIVERLGGEGITGDDLLSWLDNWIVAAERQLARTSNHGEAFEAARREADALFRAGRADAAAPLMALLARRQADAAERVEDEKRQQVTILEAAIEYDRLALNVGAAVAKYRMMAVVEGVTAGALGGWLYAKADALDDLGEARGDNAALVLAIAVYRAALEEHPRESSPLAWANTTNSLAVALKRLGQRESGTARLAEAVAACLAALEIFTQDCEPLSWAMIQNNLGNTLKTLGSREDDTTRLGEAVAAFRAALEVYTRDSVPLLWAATQNNLGNALTALGIRERGTLRLEEALIAFRAALEKYTRNSVPDDWAMTQNNLGTALQAIGARETGTVRLEAAIVAYRAALEKRTRDRVPLEWAKTQHNLGISLQMLGERGGGGTRLEEAVAAYRASLEECTRDRSPLDWAATLAALADALTEIVRRGGMIDLLEEAETLANTARAVLDNGGHAPWLASTDYVLARIATVRAVRAA